MIGNSQQVDLLCRILDAANTRHEVIAHNLANVNTPNYKRLEVVFEKELDRFLVGKSGQAKAKVVESSDVPERKDGNTVDIDVEMGQLTQNTLMMNAATQLLAMQISQLRAAISGKS